MDIPTGLIDALKQKELVIFAGAGINDGLGLPSWGEFVKKTLKYLYDNKNDRQSKNYYKNLIDQFKNEQLSEGTDYSTGIKTISPSYTSPGTSSTASPFTVTVALTADPSSTVRQLRQLASVTFHVELPARLMLNPLCVL